MTTFLFLIIEFILVFDAVFIITEKGVRFMDYLGGCFLYFSFEKEKDTLITRVKTIGSDTKEVKLPMMSDKKILIDKDFGYPRSENFFKNLNEVNISEGSYVLVMRQITVVCGHIRKEFFQGIAIYEKIKLKEKTDLHNESTKNIIHTKKKGEH